VTLLAAGIGITPLYAMALRLEAEGVPFTLHYYLKNRAGGVCPRTAAAIPRRKRGDSQLLRRDSARQHLAAALNKTHTGYPIYLCGPEGFMAAARGSPWNRAGRKR
jgi:vanillate O-demethylase ferredoxin subunit